MGKRSPKSRRLKGTNLRVFLAMGTVWEGVVLESPESVKKSIEESFKNQNIKVVFELEDRDAVVYFSMSKVLGWEIEGASLDEPSSPTKA